MKLIVEMEMPKHGCCDCMVELMGLCVIQDKDVPLTNENGDYPTELPKGCPIKGVLPEQHGDLIDRDIMYKQIQLWKSTATDTTTMGFMYHFEKLLMSARPIIASERKDDGK